MVTRSGSKAEAVGARAWRRMVALVARALPRPLLGMELRACRGRQCAPRDAMCARALVSGGAWKQPVHDRDGTTYRLRSP